MISTELVVARTRSRSVQHQTQQSVLEAIGDRARESWSARADNLVIALSGPSAVGKSTIARRLAHLLGRPLNVVHLDGYLQPRAHRMASGKSGLDPSTHDLHRASDDIRSLLWWGEARFPRYCHTSGEACPNAYRARLDSPDCLIVEGVSAFYEPLLSLSHLRIFIDADPAVQVGLLGAVQVSERGYDPCESAKAVEQKLADYLRFLKPLEPCADLVLHCDAGRRYTIKDDRTARPRQITCASG